MDWYWLLIITAGGLLLWPLLVRFGIWYYREVIKLAGEVRRTCRKRTEPEEGSLGAALVQTARALAEMQHDILFKAPKGKR